MLPFKGNDITLKKELMANQKLIVKFKLGYKGEGDTFLPVYSSKKINKTPIKNYGNCMHHLINLSSFERVYLDYLCEVMEEKTNIVHIDTLTKQSFLDKFELSTAEKRSMELLKKAVEKLKNNFLIIKLKSRGVYFVNPRYFYKSSEESRKEIIREYLEWIFKNSKENESYYREAFGISKEVVKLARKLKRV